jgi:hypothetical protein
MAKSQKTLNLEKLVDEAIDRAENNPNFREHIVGDYKVAFFPENDEDERFEFWSGETLLTYAPEVDIRDEILYHLADESELEGL